MQYLTRVIETAVLVRKAVLLICGLATALIATALCLADGLVWPPITEPPTHRHVPGKWVWAELFSEDTKTAAHFYAEAFGWTFQSFEAPRGAGYVLALSDGEPVGGMIQRDHTYDNTPGSRWLGMISVPDVKAAARYAAGHGGKVVVPPRLLTGRGEVAILADPEGAPFGVIHSSSGDPPDYLAEDRQWVWIELWAKDPKAMADFYSGLAGYEVEPVKRPDGSVGYFLASGGYTRCGIIPSPAPSVAPAWLPYLRVEDAKTATKQAEQAGARVVVPPSAAVRDGRVALIIDPTGAALGLAEVAPETQ
jgi:predicted enzyme related to lactoylglutathione lyase